MEVCRPIGGGYCAVLCDRDVDNDVFVRSSFPDTESIGDGDAGRQFAFSLPGKVADAGRLSECGCISAALAQTTFIAAGNIFERTGKDLLAGLGVAVLLYAVGFGTSLLMGTVEIASVQWVPRDLLGTLLFFLLVAVTEEVMLRGFVLGRMLSAGMNRFVALFLSSALFSAMHLFNPNFALLPFVNILLAGCLLGASFLYTRNLCFPVVLHWFWNWLQGPVLGYEVSGMDSGETLLTLRLTGSDLLTGGSFGFEGSLLCTVLLVVGTLAIIGYYERRGRKEA